MSSGTKRAAARENPRSAPGVIRADEVYTLDEVQARLQCGEWALREARRQGLKMFKMGRRKYVSGKDVLAFLESQAAAKNGSDRDDDEE